MMLGDRVYKVTDKQGSWIIVKRSDPTVDLYRTLEWTVEEAFVFTKAQYDANIEEAKTKHYTP